MVPTVIEKIRGKGDEVVRIVGEKEDPDVIQLGKRAFVSVRKHPRKAGHRVGRVAGSARSASSFGSHIGNFAKDSRRIGRGYTARWVSEEEAERLRQEQKGSGRHQVTRRS